MLLPPSPPKHRCCTDMVPPCADAVVARIKATLVCRGHTLARMNLCTNPASAPQPSHLKFTAPPNNNTHAVAAVAATSRVCPLTLKVLHIPPLPTTAVGPAHSAPSPQTRHLLHNPSST